MNINFIISSGRNCE